MSMLFVRLAHVRCATADCPATPSVHGETLDGAVRGLGVAGATELIDRPADHDDARPRARRRTRRQVGPLLGPWIPDLRAAQRSELVVARWQATDNHDAAVG